VITTFDISKAPVVDTVKAAKLEVVPDASKVKFERLLPAEVIVKPAAVLFAALMIVVPLETPRNLSTFVPVAVDNASVSMKVPAPMSMVAPDAAFVMAAATVKQADGSEKPDQLSLPPFLT
jgi:hypothetical protein